MITKSDIKLNNLQKSYSITNFNTEQKHDVKIKYKFVNITVSSEI